MILTQRWKLRANAGRVAIVLLLLLVFSSAMLPREGAAQTGQPDTLTAPAPSGADGVQIGSARFESHQLLVKLKKGSRSLARPGNPHATGLPSLDRIHQAQSIKGFERLAWAGKLAQTDAELFGWYLVTLDGQSSRIAGKLEASSGLLKSADPGATALARLIASYQADPNVEAVDLNHVVAIDTGPNDPYYASTGSWGQTYPDLWGIQKIGAASAWEHTTGSTSIIIADIDTGVDRNHPDLAANMWVNLGEICGNGIDDDGNGYVDDCHGWDWINNDNDPMDDNGHGTHTVGTIAATGNNGLGVVGVNWTSKVMALKFLDRSGSGPLTGGIKALQYAADKGARVASNSWGCQCASLALDDAIRYAHGKGVVVVVAAGNSNIDALSFSPASADEAITVAATDWNDAKASFSNWGEKIDVAAPGVHILSTKTAQDNLCAPNNAVIGTYYCRLSGTSMATPHVAGLASLLLAKNPALKNEDVRQILRRGAADLGTAGKDGSFGYGRISAAGSMSLASSQPLTPIITSPRSRSTVSGTSLQIHGGINGPNFSSYKVEVGAGRAPGTWATVTTSTTQVTNGVLPAVDTTKLTEGANVVRITTYDKAGQPYQFQVNDISVDNFEADIALPQILLARGTVDVVGSAQTKNGLGFASYTLEWGTGSNPTAFSTSGVTLTGGGAQPLMNGILGRWDTSGFAAGQAYTLRLTVTGSTGASAQRSVMLKLDADLVSGWPRRIKGANTLNSLPVSVPGMADLDGDGRKEIVLLEPGGVITVARRDGTYFPGWPVAIGSGWYLNMPVNIADLDGDGRDEIIVSATNGSWTRKVLIYRGDGTSYAGWPEPQFADGALGNATPAVADLDGDGCKDLILADMNGYLHALALTGHELAGFPKQVFPTSTSRIRPSLTLADVNLDGHVEIIISAANAVYVLDKNGNTLPGWPFKDLTVNGQTLEIVSAMATGDLDGDGRPEIAALATTASCAGCEAHVFVWNTAGAVLAGWPRGAGVLPYNNPPANAPAIADLDQDGAMDLTVATDRVYLFNAKGLKASGSYGAVAPALADTDGDGRIDIASGRDRYVTVSNSTGATVWQREFPYVSTSGYAFTTPAVMADLNGNGRVELVALWTPFGGSLSSYAFVWELPRSSAANTAMQYEWPVFGYDQARSGRMPSSGAGPAPTVTPTASVSPTASATSTNTPTTTATPASTGTATHTPAATNTPSSVATSTPSPTATVSPSSTPTTVPSATPTTSTKKAGGSGNGGGPKR